MANECRSVRGVAGLTVRVSRSACLRDPQPRSKHVAQRPMHTREWPSIVVIRFRKHDRQARGRLGARDTLEHRQIYREHFAIEKRERTSCLIRVDAATFGTLPGTSGKRPHSCYPVAMVGGCR